MGEEKSRKKWNERLPNDLFQKSRLRPKKILTLFEVGDKIFL